MAPTSPLFSVVEGCVWPPTLPLFSVVESVLLSLLVQERRHHSLVLPNNCLNKCCLGTILEAAPCM